MAFIVDIPRVYKRNACMKDEVKSGISGPESFTAFDTNLVFRIILPVLHTIDWHTSKRVPPFRDTL